jgi:hypothetical protein
MSLPPGFPATAGRAREAAILAAIAPGGAASWTWSPVRSQARGHTAIFQVLTDGIKIGGVRMSGTAAFQQTIADKLGALLQTPRMSDLVWQQAQARIQPQTMAPSSTTAALVQQSALIDRAIARLGPGHEGLVSPTGKPWVISNKMTKDHATLYGWQLSAPIPDVPSYRSSVTPGILVVQPLSNAHAPNYEDYSSLVNLMHRVCVVDGKPADTAATLADPELAWLVSHDGPCPARQPGVPVSPPFEPLPFSQAPLLVATSSGDSMSRPRSILVCPNRPDKNDDPRDHVVDTILQFTSLPLSGMLGAWIASKTGRAPI